MRVGYYINPQTPGPYDDDRVIFEVLGQVDPAEWLGFSDVWLTEHAFAGYNAYSDHQAGFGLFGRGGGSR